jgi:ABC-type lipoprotein export system ATPase subunit
MSDDAGHAVIELAHVVKTFDGGRSKVLDDVTFRVAAGEFVVLVGPSGSGKSTTLNLVGALERPDTGQISVFGHNVTSRHHLDRYRRETVGTIFQLHNLLTHLDARQNIEVVMLGTRTSRKERHDRAGTLLARLDLAAHEHDRPPELSGGERQRIAVARAFANEPRVVLADEPTGSLDDESSVLVVSLLREVCSAGGSVLAVSHDPRLIARADRVLSLRDGIVTEQTASTVAEQGQKSLA